MPQHRPTDHPSRRGQVAAAVAVALALAAGAPPAHALGFGTSRLRSALGQSLDFDVQVATDTGVPPGCVSSEVYAGESRLSADMVHADVDVVAGDTAHSTLHVRTDQHIDEPVLTVVVAAGCAARVTRRFTVFLDPAPMSGLSALTLATGPSGLPLATAAGPGTQAADGKTASGQAHPMSLAGADVSTTASTSYQPASGAPQAGGAGRGRQRSEHHAAAKLHRDPRTAARTVAHATTAPPRQDLAVVGAGRLKLDDEPDMAALTGVAGGSAASAPADVPLAGDLAARLDALESALKNARAEAAADRRALASLRAQTATAAAATPPPSGITAWLWPLLTAALAAGLGWSLWLRRRAPVNAGDWRAPASPPAAIDADAAESADVTGRRPADKAQPARPTPALQAASVPADAAAAAMSPQPTGVVVGGIGATTVASGGSVIAVQGVDAAAGSRQGEVASAKGAMATSMAHGLTVEELIDLEQQFDFFSALGQDGAAIALLQEQLAGDGSSHPMPYLKLLETYRRLGRADEHAALRLAFCKRFNVEVGAWPSTPDSGRSLEAYPEVMAGVIDAWPTPQAAVATLDRWLAADPAANDARFDMDAFTDMVFLHSLARDLAAREQRRAAISTSFDIPPSPPPAGAVSRPMPVPDTWAPLDLDVAECDIELELPDGPRHGVDSGFAGLALNTR